MNNMVWRCKKDCLVISPPKEFDFDQCLVFLNRSELEILHYIQEKRVYKLIKAQGKKVLITIEAYARDLKVTWLGQVSDQQKKDIAQFVWEFFDLGTT